MTLNQKKNYEFFGFTKFEHFFYQKFAQKKFIIF